MKKCFAFKSFKEAEEKGNELFKDNIQLFIYEVRMKDKINYPYYVVSSEEDTFSYNDGRIVSLIKKYNPI